MMTNCRSKHFLNRLSAIFPVFEKGSIRKDYDAMRLNPSADAAHRLSIATSMALQRLADRQRIGTRAASLTHRHAYSTLAFARVGSAM